MEASLRNVVGSWKIGQGTHAQATGEVSCPLHSFSSDHRADIILPLHLRSKKHENESETAALDPDQAGSRKRRKVADDELSAADLAEILQDWDALLADIDVFELQHVKAGGKLVFAFVEGPLVHALRCGEW